MILKLFLWNPDISTKIFISKSPSFFVLKDKSEMVNKSKLLTLRKLLRILFMFQILSIKFGSNKPIKVNVYDILSDMSAELYFIEILAQVPGVAGGV